MSLAQTLTSLSIAARLRLGFGCLLVLMMGIAAGGLWSLHTVNQQMRAITGPGAAKAKRVNEHTNPAHKWVALAIVLEAMFRRPWILSDWFIW